MRINVYQYERDYDNPGREVRTLAGWFNEESATEIAERTEWDGRNQVSVHQLADEFHHQSLYRTKGGRWVLCTWSQWDGHEARYEFVDDATAKEWLIVNGSGDVITQHFGEVAEESGPGRPEVGTPINIRLGDELLPRVDAEAALRGQTRAATIRGLVAAALSQAALGTRCQRDGADTTYCDGMVQQYIISAVSEKCTGGKHAECSASFPANQDDACRLCQCPCHASTAGDCLRGHHKFCKGWLVRSCDEPVLLVREGRREVDPAHGHDPTPCVCACHATGRPTLDEAVAARRRGLEEQHQRHRMVKVLD